MKTKTTKTLIIIGCLIAITCVAMAYSNRKNHSFASTNVESSVKSGVVALAGTLTQDKVHSGSDGMVSISLTLKADDVLKPDPDKKIKHADMVIVLDRSGSMNGKKIQDAKKAVENLLFFLSKNDRFALISYSDEVHIHSGLMPVTDSKRSRLSTVVQQIYAGGGTNLGAGLQQGINTLLNASKNGNTGKIILISDGQANQGITDPAALGNMAAVALKNEFAVTTVGVGNDFNEQLMTAIADRGAGSYYYMENPNAFAMVFEKEFHHTRAVAANAVKVEIPLTNGISLVQAGGYPIEIQGNKAVFYPGNLLSGQIRKLFLQLKVPVNRETSYEISGINLQYQHDGKPYRAEIAKPFHVACVADKKEALASVNKMEWEQKVLQDDFNRLKEEVAEAIKVGNENEAKGHIEKYYSEQKAANDIVGSSIINENLDKDLSRLRSTITDTFSGAPAEVVQKQKKNSKVMQYEGYQGRRMKNN